MSGLRGGCPTSRASRERGRVGGGQVQHQLQQLQQATARRAALRHRTAHLLLPLPLLPLPPLLLLLLLLLTGG